MNIFKESNEGIVVKLEEIKDLMQNVETKKWKRIRLKKGDFELDLEKESDQPVQYAEQQVEQEPVKVVTEKKSKAESKEDYVTSPMVGTFYNRPAPDQDPFVSVGDHVDEDSVVCIIEAMKVMNEVKAGKKGKIAEILIDNAQPVEFGSKLFKIV